MFDSALAEPRATSRGSAGGGPTRRSHAAGANRPRRARRAPAVAAFREAKREGRAAHASWYGPGLYGNGTACGGALTPGKLGVAHKSLRCGTRVTFRYRGRTATVPVIDRGPFAAGRDWDLTAATKRKLGFGSTGTVWSTK